MRRSSSDTTGPPDPVPVIVRRVYANVPERRTQFIVVTHNRATMETAQALYGITMDTHGVSTVLSVRRPPDGDR